MLSAIKKPTPSLSFLFYQTLIDFSSSRWLPVSLRIHWGVSFTLSFFAGVALILWVLLGLKKKLQERKASV